MSELTKTTVVLHRRPGDEPSFTDGKGHVGLILSKRDYDDLGKPAVMTITIEVGDTLN